MHVHRGLSTAQSLTGRLDYAKNPDKTDGGELVTAFACSPETADADFMLSKLRYNEIAGLRNKNSVIAYQLRQSFKPGSITAEEANRIGFEFASRFTKGQHAFIVATHIDKAHIHNHIIWNSTTLDCTRKFRNFWGSAKAAARLSDQICVEHGLSIIENPKPSRGTYGKWLGEKAKPTKRDLLCAAIEDAMKKNPRDLPDLKKLLEEAGYEIKVGKDFSARRRGDARFIRFGSLGEGYGKEALAAALRGEKNAASRRRKKDFREKRVSLLIDIEAKLGQGKGGGYQRWASVFNAKELAKTINFLQEHGFSDYAELCRGADAAVDRYNELTSRVQAAEAKLAEIAALKMQVISYAKTREVFAAYKNSRYSQKFLAEHEQEIRLHREAKQAFSARGITKLPSVKSLQAEYAELNSQKKAAFRESLRMRDEMRQYLTVRHNVQQILHGEKTPQREEPAKKADR